MDIFFTKEWANLFTEKGDGLADNFEIIENDKIISYSFIKKEINRLPFAKGLSEKYFDIFSPYGYGGIYISEAASEDYNFIREFMKKFDNYCIGNNIVAEFIRFHPLQKNYLFFKDYYTLRHINDNAYVDLKQSEEDISKNIAKRHRYCIRKAKQKGVSIDFKNNFDEIDDFIRLYESTNDKNKAADFYYFGKDFFNKLRYIFGEKIRLVTASLDDKPVSASLFIFDEKNVYYFLSGTNKSGYDVSACHLLLHDVIFKAKEEGKEFFNLGGGLKRNDNLFLFKSGFSSSILPYYVASVIRLPDVYQKLLEKSGIDPLIDYFPRYRYQH